MSKFVYSVVGLASLGAAGWVAWNVGEELMYQSRMRPLLREATRLAEGSQAVKRLLGPPPYNVHGGGRNSVRPIFRTFDDIKTGESLNEAVFWVEGSFGSSRLTVIGDSNNKLRYVWMDSQSHKGPIILFSPESKEKRSTLFGYLASMFLSKK